MAVDPETFVFALGIVVVLAFFGQLLFERTRWPDVVLLIVLGMVLGPGLGWLPVEAIQAMVPLVGTAAIIFILFDGGLNLNIKDLRSGLGPALGLGVLTFLSTMLLVAGVHHWATGAPILVSLILGAVLGGTSAIVVMPLVDVMRLEKRTKTMLGLESVVTDVLVIVGVISISAAVSLQRASPQTFARDLVVLFALAIALGVATGFAWTWLVKRVLRGRQYEYMLTLAVMFVLYGVTDFLGGAAPVGMLSFGVVLGNSKRAHKLPPEQAEWAKRQGRRTWHWGPVFSPEMSRLQDEILFFIRAFFFVALGASIHWDALTNGVTLAVSFAILAAIVLARIWSQGLLQWRLKLAKADFYAAWFLNGRGISAAVVAGLPFAAYGITEAQDFATYALALIVLTNMLTTGAVFILENERMRHALPDPRIVRGPRGAP